MNNKNNTEGKESIIDKFNNLEKKLDEDKAKLDAEQAKQAGESSKGKEPEDKKPEPTKNEDSEDNKAEPAKSEAKKPETNQEPSKEPEKKVEPKDETKPAVNPETKPEDKDLKAASTENATDNDVEKSTDHEWHTGVGVKLQQGTYIQDADLGKLIDLLTKSYDMINSHLEKTDNSVTTIKSTVDSLQDTLLPFVSKAMKVLPEEELAPKATDLSPEDEAIKSAKLENKQHQETISKSTGSTDDNTYAVDKSTGAVDEVMKSQTATKAKSDVKTQTEQSEPELTSEDLRMSAFALTGDFFNKVRKSVSDGVIAPNDVKGYQDILTKVQTGEASDDEVKKFVDFASSN